jgi:FixJ family two-component response regulator
MFNGSATASPRQLTDWRMATPAAQIGGELYPDPMTAVVFVIDAAAAARFALKGLVESDGWRCETFPDAESFLARKSVTGPTCVIADIGPPYRTLQAQAHIAARHAHTPIIFTIGDSDIATSVCAMKAGAADVLTKPLDEAAVLGAVRCALAQSTEGRRHEAALTALRDRYASLSGRECEVMDRVVAGLLNKQVAFEFGISEITVKRHRGRVMTKMNARSLADLVRMSLRLSAQPAAAA